MTEYALTLLVASAILIISYGAWATYKNRDVKLTVLIPLGILYVMSYAFALIEIKKEEKMAAKTECKCTCK